MADNFNYVFSTADTAGEFTRFDSRQDSPKSKESLDAQLICYRVPAGPISAHSIATHLRPIFPSLLPFVSSIFYVEDAALPSTASHGTSIVPLVAS